MPSNTLRRGLIWGSKCLNKIQFQNDRENDQSNKKKKHKIEILYDDRIRNPSTQLVNPIYNQRSCHRRLGVALMNCISHSCILCYQNCWALYLLLVANCSPLQRAMYKNIQEYTRVYMFSFGWKIIYRFVLNSWLGLQIGTFCISTWSRQTALGGHK
jgi:hypothetical protein